MPSTLSARGGDAAGASRIAARRLPGQLAHPGHEHQEQRGHPADEQRLLPEKMGERLRVLAVELARDRAGQLVAERRAE